MKTIPVKAGIQILSLSVNGEGDQEGEVGLPLYKRGIKGDFAPAKVGLVCLF